LLWITAVLGPHLKPVRIFFSSFVALNPLFSLAVLDGDTIHGVYQVDGCVTQRSLRGRRGNGRSIVVYLCHRRRGPFRECVHHRSRSLGFRVEDLAGAEGERGH
jgi:hypothetical protein